MSVPTVSVIIPTTCDLRREDLIHRAINSVLKQDGAEFEVTLVVNGSRVDESLLNRLSVSPIKIIRLAEGNVSKARYAGLVAARGEFFCFLDDDDEYLPGALAHRLTLFVEGVDCVVTNGWERTHEDRRLVPMEVSRLADHSPAQAFLLHNWFSSPGSMFRRESLDISLFDIRHRYFEWTLLFYLLISTGRRIRYDDALTYRKWEDNPMSASRTVDYKMANADLLCEVLALPLEDDVLAGVRLKYQTALNAQSQMHLEHRQRLSAWLSHLACIKAGGWRYLSFTRKLLFS
jgi:glycosyltransferase involved in cell wall biosynthesis